MRLPCTPLLVLAAFLSAVPAGVASTPNPTALVPGVTRLPRAKRTDSIRRGQLLLGELNCIACHQPGAAQEAHFLRRSAPILDHVGSRVRHGWLRKFLSDPQAVKPGTPMPNLLAGLPATEKQAALDALVHLLASTGQVMNEPPARDQIAAGRRVYHRVGCVACHGSRDAHGNADKVVANSVPLGDQRAKYTFTSLRLFLENPHAARPSGRMPGLLDDDQARVVANYLLQGAPYDAGPPNVTYAYYEGSWEQLPDFAHLHPVATGQTTAFDLSVARRLNDMALRFQGWLRIDREGEYRFYLTSDDGSKLWIDDRLVVANDGIHAPSTQDGSTRLTAGMHRLTAGVFNAGGGVELKLELEGPDLGRQAASPLMFLSATGPARKVASVKPDEDDFMVRPELVVKGRQFFATLGCANCHQLTLQGKRIEPQLTAPTLGKMRAEGGCLSGGVHRGVPHFALNAEQRADSRGHVLTLDKLPVGSSEGVKP